MIHHFAAWISAPDHGAAAQYGHGSRLPLLDIERGVPEVFASLYDVRNLMQAVPILSEWYTV